MKPAPKKETYLLSEEEKIKYIREFWNQLELLIKKRVLYDRPTRTKVVIKESTSVKRYGQKKTFTLTSGNKSLELDIEISPWLWTDGSLQLEYFLTESKNLVIPKRKIEDSIRGQNVKIWKPGANTWWFIEATQPIMSCMKAIELTPVDVSLFDNIEQTIKNLIK